LIIALLILLVLHIRLRLYQRRWSIIKYLNGC